MNNILNLNSRFIKFIYPVLLVVSLSGAAFGATFTVTKTADTNDGICDADCSLREAIAAANATTTDDVIGFDTSVFNTAQTILLTGNDLQINNPNGTFLINGPGSDLLKVSGNNLSRVITIDKAANVTINNITVTGGNGLSSINNGRGGGIYNAGSTLTINSSIISSNSIKGGNLGGGIFNISGGTLNINNSIISGNTAGISTLGGGIYTSAFLNLDKSTVSDNSATSGGGILVIDGITNITNSTLSGNIATKNGGGVDNNGTGTLNIVNSTISNNSIVSDIIDPNSGGGIANGGTAITLTNVTVSNNTAANAGGVANSSSNFIARNCIFARNTATFRGSADFNGKLISQGYNLIEDSSEIIITGTTIGNILGVDPQLLPLGNYGGATKTLALQPTSPAIDKGKSFGIATDQRGLPRPFDNPNIANAESGDGADIGAFEVQTAPVAASVSVSGRITNAKGRGIFNVRVTTIDSSGETRTVLSNPFGYYGFTDIPVGRTYIFNVTHKRYIFNQSAQVQTISEEIDNLNFVADN